MQGVGTGRVIAGRYGLQERRAHQGDLEVWSGTDTIAHRPVSITIFPSSIPRADAALDAARRSAVVDDPRLVAVLDVGSDHGMAWIVEESLGDSSTMANLLQCGPLGADESRRIAGEIASALDVAGRRGLHHLHLSPYAVRRTSDGRIKLAGLATAAAIEGTEEPGQDEAARIDTQGVLAVLYAALTARWPLANPMPGLAAAPRIVGGVAAPSELTAGVPADLDLLCRTVLNGQPGPASPGALAAQLAPWASRAVDATAPHGPVDDASTAPLLPLDPAPTTKSVGEPAPSSFDLAGAARNSSARVSSHATPQADRGQGRSDAPDAVPVDTGAAVSALAAAASTGGTTDAAVNESAATMPPLRGSAEAESFSPAPVGDAGSSAPHEERASSLTGPWGDRLAGAWRTALAKAEALRLPRAGVSDGERTRESAPEHLRLNQALNGGRAAPLPPPTPMASTRQVHQDGEHARLILGIVAGLLVIAMLIAVPTLFRSASSTAASPAPGITTAKPGTSARPGTVPRRATPLPIQSATGFDPLGDGTENGSQARQTYDGDPATSWTSEGYRGSAEFGGTKDGVGVIYTLAPGSKVSTAQLTLASKPQDVTVYVSTDRSLDGAQELGKLTNATGQQAVQGKTQLTGRYVIVWFTKAAPEDGDRYRCSLAEVAFS